MGKAKEKLGSLLLFLIGIRRKEKVPTEYRPRVTVMIPAYNEEEVIGDTIASIRSQTYPIDRILVIDDCSIDRTNEIAKNLGVEVLKTPQNTGTKTQALNFAIKHVQTEVIVTVDADTILDKRAIELAVSGLADGQTLSVCGFVIPQKTKTFWEKARLVQYLYYTGLNKGAQAHWGTPLVSSGCFSALNTQVLKEMGGFPEGTIAEDMALTWQGHLQGKKTKFFPRVVCYPKDPSNWRQYKRQVMRWRRGFLQCIGIYKFQLAKNISLAFFVLWYLLSGIVSPFLWIFFVWYLVALVLGGRYHPQPFLVLVLFGALVEVALLLFVVLITGIRYKRLRHALISLPCHWIVAPIDSFLFLSAIVQEWFLGRKLRVWEKGH